MNKIIYSCAWGKEKETSWSGTNYGLLKGLQKYCILEEFDVGYVNNKKNINVLPQLCFDRFNQKLLKIDDFGLGMMKCFDRIATKKYSNEDVISIQFSECPHTCNVKSYVYQDLHVGYIKKMYEEMPEVFKTSGFQHIRKKYIDKREKYQREFYDDARAIFTMGQWLKNEIVDNYGICEKKVIHVGGGYNVDPSKIDESKKNGNRILFVGRDFKRKNGLLVVEAFKKAKVIRPEIELYIAGPKELDIHEEGLHLLGDMNTNELVNYFNLCDVFCMPSKFEAYGLVFPEALIFGLPCIGRNAFEMPYFIEDGVTGRLLKEENSTELSTLILETLLSSEMKNNVLKKRQWYLKEYSWDSVAQRMVTAIKNIEKLDRLY